ncbi:MAG: hypothetical protein F2532_03500 [Actinobacteria bacterium]|nr:hypothetical protein [Actinomycetota bacterium]
MNPSPRRFSWFLPVLCAYLVGVVAATVGCFWQSGQSILGSVAVPVGLVAALFVTWLGGRIVVTSTSQRWAPTAYAVAFIQMVLTLTATTAAGDVVVAATWYGYSFLILSLLIVALTAVRHGMFGPRRLR